MSGGVLDALRSPLVLQALRLSFLTSLISITLVLLVGTPFAYFLARRRLAGRGVLELLVELPLVLPPVVAGLGMLMAFGRKGLLGGWLEGMGITLPFTTFAVVLAQVFVAAPFYIRSARLGFHSVDQEFEDISLTMGKSPLETFWRVTLPLALPSVVGGLALAWARAISEFGATLMFAGNFPGRTQTLPLAIMNALEVDLGAALALAMILVIIAIAVLGTLGYLARNRWRIRL